MASKAVNQVMDEYRATVEELMEGKAIEGLYNDFIANVSDEIINELPFPEELRSMNEDDMVEKIHEIIYEELYKKYFKSTGRIVEGTA